MFRTLTCPICETILRLPMARAAPDGTETYELPLHRPTLSVNLCLAMPVRITFGPYRYTTQEELAGVPPPLRPQEDPRRG
jgi:hypothetical protein